MLKKSVLLAAFALAGYSFAADAPASNAAPKAKAAVQNYQSKEAKVGDTVVCPVKGETFTITGKSKTVKIKDKAYYVCCGGCVGELQKNPDKYLAAADTEAKDGCASCGHSDCKEGSCKHKKGEHPKSEHPN